MKISLNLESNPISRKKLNQSNQITNFSTTNKKRNLSVYTSEDVESPLKTISNYLAQSKDSSVISIKDTMIDDPEENGEHIKKILQKKQRMKSEYQNSFYKKALQYSQQKKYENEFNKQYKKMSISTPKSMGLHDINIKKKGQLLTQKNKHVNNKTMIQQYLKDRNYRQMTLQKALLLQRFYYLIKQGKQKDIKQKNQIPKRFKGLNPKHMRLKTRPSQIQAYQRQKYVETKLTLQYFDKAQNVQRQQINNKIKENSNLIKLLVDLNLNSNEVQDKHQKQKILIKRLFLKYSNNKSQDTNQLYKIMGFDNLKQFCRDLSIEIHQNKILQFYEKLNPINIFKFYEILNRISRQLYGIIPNLIQHITSHKFQCQKSKFLHPIWIELEQNSQNLKQLFSVGKKFYQKLQKCFIKQTSAKYMKKNRLNYMDIFQFLWRYNIFPNFITKSKIRYFYEYCSTQLEGLNLIQFIQLLNSIAIYVNKQPAKSTKEKIVNFIKNYNYFEFE